MRSTAGFPYENAILDWAGAAGMHECVGANRDAPPSLAGTGGKFRNFPLPAMQGIGDATLTITTSSDQAQAYFNQGLRVFHCFWDFEAYRAFKEAAHLDLLRHGLLG